MECGWIVTEIGRQPWVVYQQFRTADAVTTNNVVPALTVIVVLYVCLGVGAIMLLRSMSRRWRTVDSLGGPAIRGPVADQFLSPVRGRRP
jgi:cytochrome d ubiquinol oxidase subunit I